MLIVDASVLLSPYVLTILRGIQPLDFAIAEMFDTAIGATDRSFVPLVRFYGVFGSQEEVLRRWVRHYSRQIWGQQYRTINRPGDDEGATIFDHLLGRFGPSRTQADRIVARTLVEQIWGAISEGCPILALGSPVPELWDIIGKVFAEQMAKRDLRLTAVDPTSEFQRYGIPPLAVSELDLWFIEVLAPSPTMVEYLTPGEFLGKLKFVAFSIERDNYEESVD